MSGRTVAQLAEIARRKGWGHPSWSNEALASIVIEQELEDARADEPYATARESAAAPAPAVSRAELDSMLHAIADGVGAAISRERTTVRQLEKRVRELEAKPELKFAGVWRAGKQYVAGDVVSDRGSAWVAKTANEGQRPGDTRLWTLVVKRGRDGKDAAK